MTAILDRPMAHKTPGLKPSTPRNDVTAKIDADAMQIVRLVATYRKQTIAEYLTEMVNKYTREEWERIKSSKN